MYFVRELSHKKAIDCAPSGVEVLKEIIYGASSFVCEEVR